MCRLVCEAGRIRLVRRTRHHRVATVDAHEPWSLAHTLSRVKEHRPTLLPAEDLKTAAVLAPLIETDDGLSLVLTMRPASTGVHGGQVSFPGGHVELEDADRWDTALREAQEELGLPPAEVERVGQLDDFRTVTHFHITPCVGIIPPDTTFQPCEREVADVFTVPLRHFFEPPRRRTMRFSGRGPDRRVYFYLTEPYVVWGATAAMIHGLTEILSAP